MESLRTVQPLTDSDQRQLSDLCTRACTRARERGRPVLLGYAFHLPGCDPLAVARYRAEQAAAPSFRFYWERPAEGFALAAGGTAQHFEAGGAERFARAAAAVDSALAGAVAGREGEEDGEDVGPGVTLLGGFSFFDRLDQGEWQGFGPARLVAPQWLIRRKGRHVTGQVHLGVAPGDAPEAVVETVAERVAALRTAVAVAPRLEEWPDEAAPPMRRENRSDGHDVWLEVVRAARDRIRDGRLTKVVLARALDLEAETPPSPYGLLRRLREAYPHCYAFLVDAGEGQSFLGATPEQLARFNNGTVRMAAVAGTVPRGDSPEAEEAHARHLLESHKEREEHAIVVEGIVNAVAPYGTVTRPEAPQLIKLNNVQHLYTPITLRLARRVPALELLGSLHPTPAVGGHPREQAFALIRESEHFDRGWYASPVGWIDARGEGEFCVALRSGTIAGRRVRLFAGGGIVAESDPEREFEETQIKFQPLLRALERD